MLNYEHYVGKASPSRWEEHESNRMDSMGNSAEAENRLTKKLTN